MKTTTQISRDLARERDLCASRLKPARSCFYTTRELHGTTIIEYEPLHKILAFDKIHTNIQKEG